MQVEDVARISFTSRRTTQQQRDLTICPSLLGQVVINDQGVFAAVAEVFAHRGAGVRSDVLHGSRLGSRSSNNDGVVHGAILFELGDNIGDGRGLLTDSDVNADQILTLLVNDRVNGDSGLTRLTVANDQLTLTAADRHHRVKGLQAGMNRLGNGLTIDDARGDLFDNVKFLGFNRPLAVNRLAERVDNAADQLAADRNRKNAAGGLHRVAFGNTFVVAENNGADGIAFEVQSEAINLTRELQHFALHHVAQAVNTSNAVGQRDHGALCAKISGNAEAFDTLLQQFTDFTGIELHLTAPNFMR